MIALVTGGTKGIGLAMVKALKREGYTVAVVGRSKDGPDCDLYIRADLHDKARGIVDHVVKTLGGIDLLVNNAGEQIFSPFVDYKLADLHAQLELMLIAPFLLSQEAAMYMPHGSHIVNVLSTAAFQGARNISGYVTVKHALLGLTRAMAIELAPDIHVNAIAPGLTETDMIKNISPEREVLLKAITPMRRYCRPEEIADALIYLVKSTAVYGQTITVDGGWMAKNG